MRRATFSFMLLAVVGLVGVTVCYAVHAPEGAAGVGLLVTSLLGMLGWRAAQPVPEGGANLSVSRAGLRSMISGNISEEIISELDPNLRLARAVLLSMEARGVGIPEEVRQRVSACQDRAQLLEWLERAPVVPAARDLLTPQSATTQPYPMNFPPKGE